MTYPAEVHDALRAQGLVPEAEDIHFDGCSTGYRTRMIQAFYDEDSPSDLRADLAEQEEKTEWGCLRADNAEHALEKANADIADLRGEIIRLQSLVKESA